LIKGWKASYSSFDNWVRLNAVMALLAYFEVYLGTIVLRAIHSDPGVLIGRPRAVDGVALIKANRPPEFSDIIKRCVHGTWTGRTNQYKEIFGTLPADLAASIGELDRIRLFRNSIGHAFGRDTVNTESGTNKGTASDPTVDPKEMKRLAQDRVKKWMKVIWDVAAAVEAHLGGSHIGEYENMLYYHANRVYRGYVKNPTGSGSVPLYKGLGLIHGIGLGKEWAKRLVDHYEQL
jgi:hypothetical protein